MIREARAQQFEIIWEDGGREPQCPPNPAYPDGIDVALPNMPDAIAFCKITVPYPARRCGVYHLECKLCQVRVAITTAGRPDDPRSVTVPCKGQA